jgi:hypothetical protein
MNDLRQKASHTFLGGMNKDLGDAYLKPNQYRHAENFRVISDKNGQSGALNNVKGMYKSIDDLLLRTSNVYSYIQDYNESCSYAVTVDGITVLFAINETSLSFLYAKMKSLIEAQWSFLKVSYDRNWLILHTDDLTHNNFTCSIVPQGVTATGQTSLVMPYLDDLIIIGYSYVRDDIILFTCSTDAFINNGQIWKLNYDESTPIPTSTIELLYNNKLNFSIDHPIRDAKGHYENTECVKVYFTDDYNYLRCFNYADSNAFAIPPELIDIMGDVYLTKPQLENITSGSLQCGVIQYAYKLYNKYGGETQLSPFSNMIHLAKGSDFGSYTSYTGGKPGENSGKGLIIKVKNIDRRYKFIKLYSAFYKDGSSEPELNQIADMDVDSDDIYITDDGKTILAGLTQDELNIYSNVLFKCKTMDIKNNLLVVGNTSGETFDVDFDARAYRFDKTIGSPIAKIKDKNGTIVNVDTSFTINGDDVPLTHDCINIDQDIYKYKSTINPGSSYQAIGGSGPNVEYEIKALDLWSHYVDATQIDAIDYHENVTHEPWNLWLDDNFVDNKSSFAGYSSPFNSGMLRTYMREETYRFGIVFFSKKGLRSSTKWIGDIKMPKIMDGFRTFDGVSTGQPYQAHIHTYPIYLDFKVTIPDDIKDQISGFEIVRVKRTLKDKTVVSQGILTSIGKVTQYSNNSVWGRDYNNSYEETAISTPKNYKLAGFYSPDGILDKNLFLLGGDKMSVVFRMQGRNMQQFNPPNSGGNTHVLICAYYHSLIPLIVESSKKTLYDCQTTDININRLYDVVSSSGKNLYHNGSGVPTSSGECYSIGGPCNVLGIDCDLTQQPGGVLANYYRTQDKQYGGSSYEERTFNQYISTGAFFNMKEQVLSDCYLKVFGGDTFITCFDVQSDIWNIANEVGSMNTLSGSHIFPVESEFNLSLRTDKGYYKTLDYRLQGTAGTYYITSSGSTGAKYYQQEDLYQYNPAYSRQSEVQLFFAENLNLKKQQEFDCRIRASSRKTNGEFTDSWSKFLVLTYIDINTNLGEITKLINFKNVMYGFQNNGVGVASIDDRSIVQSTTATSIVLGNGDVLPRYDYISMNAGTKHQFSVIPSEEAVYFFDSTDRQIKVMSGSSGSISDSFGMKSYIYNNTDGLLLSNDNPYSGFGVNGYYDDRYNEVVMSFHKGLTRGNIVLVSDYFTISFNEALKAFTGFYSFASPIYIRHYSKIFSTDREIKLYNTNSDAIYLHNFGNYNTFYENKYKSKINLVVNDNYAYIKVFDSILWECDVDDISNNMLENFFKYIRCFNNYQNTDWHELVFNTTPAVGKQINYDRRERIYSFQFPRNIVDQQITSNPNIFDTLFLQNVNRPFRERLRDKSLNVEMVYDNPDNKKFSSQVLTINYRISAR